MFSGDKKTNSNGRRYARLEDLKQIESCHKDGVGHLSYQINEMCWTMHIKHQERLKDY